MLKYTLLSEDRKHFTWDVRLWGKHNPTVGNYIYAIKQEKKRSTRKNITIYRKGIVVGSCVFHGQIAEDWQGDAKELWEAPAGRVEMSDNGMEQFWRIYIKEPREGACVVVIPWLPKLLDAIRVPIPQGAWM